MTAAVPWAALAAVPWHLWPLLSLPLLLAIAPWIRRREWVRAARHHWSAHPSIDQASHDRPEVVHDPQEET